MDFTECLPSIGKFVKSLLIYFLTLSHLKFADK